MHDVRLILLDQTIGATWHQGHELVGMPAYVDNMYMKLGRWRAKGHGGHFIGRGLGTWSAIKERDCQTR